ncbi:hypothetical protein D3C81_2039640 [compost metagenome]
MGSPIIAVENFVEFFFPDAFTVILNHDVGPVGLLNTYGYVYVCVIMDKRIIN